MLWCPPVHRLTVDSVCGIHDLGSSIDCAWDHTYIQQGVAVEVGGGDYIDYNAPKFIVTPIFKPR